MTFSGHPRNAHPRAGTEAPVGGVQFESPRRSRLRRTITRPPLRSPQSASQRRVTLTLYLPLPYTDHARTQRVGARAEAHAPTSDTQSSSPLRAICKSSPMESPDSLNGCLNFFRYFNFNASMIAGSMGFGSRGPPMSSNSTFRAKEP